MPFNLMKKYNELLELSGMNPNQRKQSLKGIFDRDIKDNLSFRFKGKQIRPISKDGAIPMETLFNHLITEITDYKTKKREFDIHRAKRLHWVKHHVEEKKKQRMLVFSAKDKNGLRTYILDEDESYVIVLEPKINAKNEAYYFFLTAYYLRGGNTKKIKNKYKRRLNELL